jgi:hypothetical protein
VDLEPDLAGALRVAGRHRQLSRKEEKAYQDKADQLESNTEMHRQGTNIVIWARVSRIHYDSTSATSIEFSTHSA